jgi:4a-hydroxytetrahydrobiopterin dehydratase
MTDPLTEAEAASVVATLAGWTAKANKSMTKTFTFPDHIEAMGFVTRVAMAAEVANHHPDLRIVYDTVEITLSTHDAGGLTEKDIGLAARIDGFA